jgi:hypothetical protein
VSQIEVLFTEGTKKQKMIPFSMKIQITLPQKIKPHHAPTCCTEGPGGDARGGAASGAQLFCGDG